MLAALLERHHARRFSGGASIDFDGPGVVVLAREYPDGTSVLVSAMFAHRTAGNVARSLLHVQCAAGKNGHFIFIVSVEKLYDAWKVQLAFSGLCHPNRFADSQEAHGKELV